MKENKTMTTAKVYKESIKIVDEIFDRYLKKQIKISDKLAKKFKKENDKKHIKNVEDYQEFFAQVNKHMKAEKMSFAEKLEIVIKYGLDETTQEEKQNLMKVMKSIK